MTVEICMEASQKLKKLEEDYSDNEKIVDLLKASSQKISEIAAEKKTLMENTVKTKNSHISSEFAFSTKE